MILYAKHNTWFTLWAMIVISCFKTAQLSWLNRSPVSTLPDGIDHVVAACQEDNMFLQCRNRYNKLFIKEAFYGRDNTFTCASKVSDTSKMCEGKTPSVVVEKVNLMCNGENKCKIPVTPEFLEKKGSEICTDIRKYLRVSYACHQVPQLHATCGNNCTTSCWPSCKKSCCEPKPPAPTTCNGKCPNQCAPDCSFSCCHNAMASSVGHVQLPLSTTLCPVGCPSDCAPSCSSACCNSRKTTASQFNQPPPTLQYERHKATSPLCDSFCSPSSCSPTCDPMCCQPSSLPSASVQIASQPQITTCPQGCSSQCAPSCLSSCCQASQFLSAAPPPPPPSCPVGCSQSCAPLCQPTCCQSTQVAQSQSTCAAGCPYQCAPLCSPTCCESMSAPRLPPLPAMSYAAPAQITPLAPMQFPAVPMLPPQPPPQLPPQALQPVAIPSVTALQKGCPVNCIMACLPRCPSRCCIAQPPSFVGQNALGSVREIQQRQTYQQMLQRFREKQLQQYAVGK